VKKTIIIALDGEERTITLVPKFGYLSLPIGTVLYAVDGERVVVGEDELDMEYELDGYLQYGVLED
jgi:hypothetical protein